MSKLLNVLEFILHLDIQFSCKIMLLTPNLHAWHYFLTTPCIRFVALEFKNEKKKTQRMNNKNKKNRKRTKCSHICRNKNKRAVELYKNLVDVFNCTLQSSINNNFMFEIEIVDNLIKCAIKAFFLSLTTLILLS